MLGSLYRFSWWALLHGTLPPREAGLIESEIVLLNVIDRIFGKQIIPFKWCRVWRWQRSGDGLYSDRVAIVGSSLDNE